MINLRVLVHIVTWNSERTIRRCLERAIAQEGVVLGESLWIRITDNASSDGTLAILDDFTGMPGIEVVRNQHNLGFCGGHNQGASQCVHDTCDALLILNPDVGLLPHTVVTMLKALDDKKRCGLVTPKLLRAGKDLCEFTPRTLDAAGMYLTPTLRHFDRGSNQIDEGGFDLRQEVFGGTGACLMISRECIESLALPVTISDESVWRIYPQLRQGSERRIKLFDEAFFAYREDADLSWRARRKGWRCIYEPMAVATHVRVVTPERRGELPAPLNALGVRNRFLLQFNNWSWREGALTLVGGLLWRNALVVLGVIAFERSSMRALKESWLLATRGRAIYRATSQVDHSA